MKKLLNTLYVTLPDAYLALDGENIAVRQESADTVRLPLHNLEGIVTMGYTGASPALMGHCAKLGIGLCFLTPNGRFLARVCGETRGNIALRHTQFRMADSTTDSLRMAKGFLIGKLYNSRSVICRAMRDYPLRLDMQQLSSAADKIAKNLHCIPKAVSLEELRGLEGDAAKQYFSVFDLLILQQKEDFFFTERSRRPPLDNMNALLSFLYTLLANDIASALEAVGLDPYEGFLHRERPGRKSLALDVMEELRAVMADRLALSLVNRKTVRGKDFVRKENGAIVLVDDARKTVLQAWQERKREEIQHPYLREKILRGLLPHVQSLLLARTLRGDLDAYPPYLWK